MLIKSKWRGNTKLKKFSTFLLGLVIGAAVVLSSTALADSTIKNLIGQTIQGQFPVTVDGAQLSNPAIVTDGTSFLPVREFGELVGYNVSFDPEGKVILNKKTGDPVSTAQIEKDKKAQELIKKSAAWNANVDKNNQISEIQGKMNGIADETKQIQSSIAEYEKKLVDNKEFNKNNDPNFTEETFLSSAFYKEVTSRINAYKQRLSDLQANLADLQNQLSTLQSELVQP
jgi:peptidoglycan hydrolase CwlO-like protein